MKGDVLGFDPDTNAGAISGHDGQRYEFVRLDWRGAAQPMRGEIVDFVAVERRATEIYPLAFRGNPAEGNTAELIYILYLVSLVTGVTGIVGIIMAYVSRNDGPDWVRTHYRFQIRTFWIGMLFIFISLVTAVILIGFVLWLLTVVWLIVRCAKGMQAIARGQPYENAASWLW